MHEGVKADSCKLIVYSLRTIFFATDVKYESQLKRIKQLDQIINSAKTEITNNINEDKIRQ